MLSAQVFTWLTSLLLSHLYSMSSPQSCNLSTNAKKTLKSGKLTSGHRTGKGQFSFQSQRKAMPKNARTTTQLHSFHMLVKYCSKFSKPGFSNMWTVNLEMFKLVFKKAEEPEIKLPTSAGSSKKQECQKNIYFCFIDYAKAFDCVDHHKLWKILKEIGIRDYLTCL